ncbi:MAG: RNA polymerase sigma-70 factor [Tannerella sp.]|jgi:RNA polymerase sigma-70 factor (ECF subfamily)|nr:RNA polymerase sigma-70 factor [Tannerella sp.]
MFEIHITDEKLIAAIKKDDYAGYNNLFTRYYSRLCRYVYGMLENREDAEDVVQELFLNLWNNRKRIEITENVSGYLFKMAKNLSLNHIRSAKNYRNMVDSQSVSEVYYEESLLEFDEFRIALYDCIERLPERSREVFLLHRVKKLKQKEISEKLTVSVKTIKNQIWMSLQKLKKCMEVKGYYTNS